jgi:hypothetical protein
MTTIEAEVRRRASDYVAGRSTLADFDLWLAAVSWNLDETADPELRELIGTIELRIAEFTSGVWNERELRDRIQLPLNAPTVVLTAFSEALEKRRRIEYLNRAETCSLQLAVV